MLTYMRCQTWIPIYMPIAHLAPGDFARNELHVPSPLRLYLNVCHVGVSHNI